MNPDTSLRAGEELMLKPPPERTLPISEMSEAQISIYRRALVRYLKKCATDDPRCQEQRNCLAEVMAEERARRLAESASGMTLAVPRIHLLQVQGHKDPGPCGTGYGTGRASDGKKENRIKPGHPVALE